MCTSAMWWATFSSASSAPSATSPRKELATDTSASLGHGRNQSMTVQLTSAGKRRARVRNTSPTGEKASTTCRLARTREMKKSIIESRDSGTAAALAAGRSEENSPSYSSAENRSGITPEERRSLT